MSDTMRKALERILLLATDQQENLGTTRQGFASAVERTARAALTDTPHGPRLPYEHDPSFWAPCAEGRCPHLDVQRVAMALRGRVDEDTLRSARQFISDYGDEAGAQGAYFLCPLCRWSSTIATDADIAGHNHAYHPAKEEPS